MSIVRKSIDYILNPQDYKIELITKEGKNLAPEQDNHRGSDFYLISSYQKKGEIASTETNVFFCGRIYHYS